MTPSLVTGRPGDPKMAKRCNIVTRCIAAIALKAIEQAPQKVFLARNLSRSVKSSMQDVDYIDGGHDYQN
jgi:hypothetical protein